MDNIARGLPTTLSHSPPNLSPGAINPSPCSCSSPPYFGAGKSQSYGPRSKILLFVAHATTQVCFACPYSAAFLVSLPVFLQKKTKSFNVVPVCATGTGPILPNRAFSPYLLGRPSSCFGIYWIFFQWLASFLVSDPVCTTYELSFSSGLRTNGLVYPQHPSH